MNSSHLPGERDVMQRRDDTRLLPVLIQYMWSVIQLCERRGNAERAARVSASPGGPVMRTATILGTFMIALPALVQAQAAASSAKLDTAKIEELTGAKGKLDEKAGVFKVTVPRSDLSVTAAGVHITPALGLTSW